MADTRDVRGLADPMNRGWGGLEQARQLSLARASTTPKPAPVIPAPNNPTYSLPPNFRSPSYPQAPSSPTGGPTYSLPPMNQPTSSWAPRYPQTPGEGTYSIQPMAAQQAQAQAQAQAAQNSYAQAQQAYQNRVQAMRAGFPQDFAQGAPQQFMDWARQQAQSNQGLGQMLGRRVGQQDVNTNPVR